MNRVLFVDDEPAVLESLKTVLWRDRSRWSMRFAAGGEAALAALRAEPFDVVVTDMRMPGMTGVDLLEAVRTHHPGVSRIVLSGQADTPALVRASAVAHRYLAKPCDPGPLRAAVDGALALQALQRNETIRGLVGGVATLPAAPAAYTALTGALANPGVEMAALAAIVEQDVGLSARALQFANAAALGLSSRVSGIEAALRCLGLNTIRHLALSVEVFRRFGVAAGAALEALELHALRTARVARELAPAGPAADAAFAAGLLHDAGKLLLLDRGPADLCGIVELPDGRGVEAERAALGADHAELGAYLFGLWDLPHDIIEPVANHHAVVTGGRGSHEAERVALADALVHEWSGAHVPGTDHRQVFEVLAGRWDLAAARGQAAAALGPRPGSPA